MQKLILVRHGEAEHLTGNRLTGGWTESSLTDRGRFQAKKTGSRLVKLLARKSFAFLASDLSRAGETARIIGEVIGAEPVLTKRLRELNNGIAANSTLEEAEKLMNPISKPLLDWVPYPQAESWRQLHQRVCGMMDELASNGDQMALIVSHGGVMVSITHWWLGLPDYFVEKTSFDFDPCSLTYLRVNKWNERTISRLNDTSHLNNSDYYQL
ncbi:MAG: histidine phosphatase family protein [Halanaerobium sp.]|nr:histidine phosphatase family protein [Halanaerobium sp.]